MEKYKSDELEFMEDAVNKYTKFIMDFDMEASIRNINCFAYACKRGASEAKNYVINRVKLTGGNSDFASKKVQSQEFRDIVNRFRVFELNGKVINKRLKIYFGAPGSGKTTEALKEANNNCIICNSSMLPCDLIEDFKLSDGKGNLAPSPLRYAMENGLKVVLDEIGTLSLDCLRFLQGITDNKQSFNYKGDIIEIKDGFEIIGTMNLFINGVSYPLTDALVDRCEFDGLKEFHLSSKKLIEYGLM